MKKVLVLLVAIIAVGATSYLISYRRAFAPVVVTPDGTDSELAWLKHEFQLTDAQYDKVLKLHRAYRPVCASHCSRYIETHHRLNDLLKSEVSWSPEIAQAMSAQAQVQSECHASMLKYAYDVANCMSPREGRRYLEMIKLQIVDGDPARMFEKAR